jgi:hypothetical protein
MITVIRATEYWQRVRQAQQFIEDLLDSTGFLDSEILVSYDSLDPESRSSYLSEKNDMAIINACDRFQVRYQDLVGVVYL